MEKVNKRKKERGSRIQKVREIERVTDIIERERDRQRERQIDK